MTTDKHIEGVHDDNAPFNQPDDVTPDTGETFTADDVRAHLDAIEYTDDFTANVYVVNPDRFDALTSGFSKQGAQDALDRLCKRYKGRFRVVTQWQLTCVQVDQATYDAWVIEFAESLRKFGTTS